LNEEIEFKTQFITEIKDVVCDIEINKSVTILTYKIVYISETIVTQENTNSRYL